MKKQELERCLGNKLGLQKRMAARHIDYRLCCAGELIALPTVLRVSHGSSELSDRNVGGIAQGLGLTEYAVREMTGCRIGRACVLLCLAAKLLVFVQHLREQQGELFRPGLVAMLESVEILMAEPDISAVSKWTTAERKTLDRLHVSAAAMVADGDVGPLAKKIVTQITSHA